MACDIETIQEAACESGIGKVDAKIRLLQIIAQLTCEIAEAGTGGGGEAGAGSPEGALSAEPGTTYFNTSDSSFWVKATGSGSTGWIQLIA